MQASTNQNAVLLHRYPLWRDALTEMLSELGFTVIKATDSADEAVAVVKRARPGLFVAGAARSAAGPESTIDCVRRARIAVPELKAVVLAASYDEVEAEAAVAAGAYAYIVELTNPTDIRAAIRQGFRPSVFFGVDAVEAPLRRPLRAPAAHGRLTKRELEILRSVAEGSSNAEVAAKLWVTEQTVKFHLSNIYRKLDVANRTEASRWAQLTGLLDDQTTSEPASGSV